MATATSFAKRSTHSCFDAVTISWRSSSGQQQSHLLARARDLSEDWCPVFFHEDLDELVRLRISDISVDSDSQTCLHGHCLYTKRQLPPNARGIQLPPSFIESTELAESREHRRAQSIYAVPLIAPPLPLVCTRPHRPLDEGRTGHTFPCERAINAGVAIEGVEGEHVLLYLRSRTAVLQHVTDLQEETA